MDLPYEVIGKHYGASLSNKLLGFPIRCIQLFRHLADRRIDVAISHSSFYSPVVARMLGARCIYLNDNEHAAGNLLSFRLATSVMVPEHLDLAKVERQGAAPHKIIVYPGLKEGVCLWNLAAPSPTLNPIARNGRPILVYRPEPLTAQYYTGDAAWMDEVLLALTENYDCYVSPRDTVQRHHYAKPRFHALRVLEQPVPLALLSRCCDLFIGAGGTMTREAAILGIPTISIYQGELLDVDRYLLGLGRMVHSARITPEFVAAFTASRPQAGTASDLLEKGRQAYEAIKANILTNSHG
jgi:predicted glycosyltransferase